MDISLRPFAKEDFKEYHSWFVDKDLEARLGPMDQAWLDHVLEDNEGDQYGAFSNSHLVGVLGVALPHKADARYVITDIAVRPDLKGQGIGSRIFDLAIDLYKKDVAMQWLAYIEHDNTRAIALFRSCGWTIGKNPDADDMITATKVY